jgi:hypothetical protein
MSDTGYFANTGSAHRFDPHEVGRRSRLLLSSYPIFAEEPEAMTAVATADMDDAEMLEGATSALSQASWTSEADRRRRQPIAAQRGRWKMASESEQKGLLAAGYIPPDTPEGDDDDKGLFGEIMDAGASLMEGAGKVLTTGPVDTGLQWLTNVGDFPMHLWRTASELADSDQQGLGDFFATATALGGASLFLRGHGLGDIVRAFEETGTGSRYYTDASRTEAKTQASEIAIDTPTIGISADDRLDVASDLLAGKSPEEIAAKYGAMGSETNMAAFTEITQLQSDAAFKKVHSTLDHGQVSPGRGLASAIGLAPTSTAYTLLSGATDMAYQIALDPTLAFGKATKAIKLGMYGLDALNYAPRIAQMFERSAAVRRAAAAISEVAQVGADVHRWARRYPGLSIHLDSILENRERLAGGAEAVRDWWSESQVLGDLLRGTDGSWRSGKVLIPHLSVLGEAKAGVRSAAAGTLNWSVDVAAKGRRNVRAALGEVVPETVEGGKRFSMGAIWIPGTEKAVVWNPLLWGTQVSRAASIKVPEAKSITMAGRLFPKQIMAFVEMGVLADVPSKVRAEWFNKIVNEGSMDSRLRMMKTVIHDMFGYLPEDAATADFKNRLVNNIDQHFGPNDIVPGMAGKYGKLPDADSSLDIAIPQPKEFMAAASKINIWRATTSKLNNGMVDAFMSTAWKPSILLRVGFIPRAAGEEMLNYALRNPLGLVSGWAKASAGADTKDYLAELAGYSIGDTVTPKMLEQEWAALGPEVTRAARRNLDWEGFLKIVQAADPKKSPTLRKMAWSTVGGAVPGTNAPAVGPQILQRYWYQQAHAPQALIRPFQMVAGVTGGIARPGKLEVETRTKQLVDEGWKYKEALGKAKRDVAEKRSGWVAHDNISLAIHNIAKTGVGPESYDGMDVWARSVMYHSSQLYRSTLRRVMNPDDIAAVRLFLHDDVYKRQFAEAISAGNAGFFENPEETRRRMPVDMLGDRTATPRTMVPKRSKWMRRRLRETENEQADPLAFDAMLGRAGHIAGDRVVGNRMAEVASRYMGADTAAEYTNLPLPVGARHHSEFGTHIEYVQHWHEVVAETMNELPAHGKDVLRFALSTGRRADFMHAADVITDYGVELQKLRNASVSQRASELMEAGAKPKEAAEAAWHEVQDFEGSVADVIGILHSMENLSPRAQRMTQNMIDARISSGKVPEIFGGTREELSAKLVESAVQGLTDPEWDYLVRAMGRNGINSHTGEAAINAVKEGFKRIYVPLADREAYKAALQAGGTLNYAPELTGTARIGVQNREERTAFAEGKGVPRPDREMIQEEDIDMDVFESGFGDGERYPWMEGSDIRGSTWTPVAAFATPDHLVAKKISADMAGQLGQTHMADGMIGYIDVPIQTLKNPVARRSDEISRLHYAEGATVTGVHYRMEPSMLARIEPAPLHTQVHSRPSNVTPEMGLPQEVVDATGDDLLFGPTHEQAIESWADVLTDNFLQTFYSHDRDEMLSEMLLPVYRDAIAPLEGINGREWRSSSNDIHAIPSRDRPEFVMGPEYDLLDEPGRWAKFTRWGFDTIGDAINGLIRKPYFLNATLNAYAEAMPYAEELRDPRYWGKRRVTVHTRTDHVPLPDTPEIRALTPHQQVQLRQNQHVVGSIVISNPSDDMLLHLRGTDEVPGPFPDFPGFVLPGTAPVVDAHGVTWPMSGLNSPVLSRWMDTNLHGMRSYLDELAKTGPTDKLQTEAASLADVLTDVSWNDAPGGLMEEGSRYVIEQPRNMNTILRENRIEVDEEGLLHPIARHVAGLRLNELMRTNIPRAVENDFVQIGRQAFGDDKLTTGLIMDRLQLGTPDDMAHFLHTARNYGRTNTGAYDNVNYLIESVPQTVKKASKLIDPEDMMDAWARLPARLKDPKLPFEEFRDDVETPEWLKRLSPRDLPVLRAAEANAAAVAIHLKDVAIDRAMYEMTPFIDNHNNRSQFQEYGRNMIPFWFAEEAFLRRWVKTVNPLTPEGLAAIRRGQLLYQGLRGSGVVRTDDQGKPVLVYPGTPAMSAAMGWMIGGNPIAKRVFGQDMGTPIASMLTGDVRYALSGNFQGFSIPSPSPLVTIPLEGIANMFPEIKPLQEQLSGARATGRMALESTIPTSVRRIWTAFNPNSDALARSQAQVIQWRAAHEDLPPQDASPMEIDHWLDQTRQQARTALIMQMGVGFVVPAPPEAHVVGEEAFTFAVNSGERLKGTDLHPEFARLVQSLGFEEGTQAFLEKFPDSTPHDAFNANSAWLVSQSARTGRAPLPTTEAAAEFYQNNEDWLRSFPLAGGWLLPVKRPDDKYSQKAYYQQVASELRIRKTPEEFVKDMYVSAAAPTYYDTQEQYYQVRMQLDGLPEGMERTQALAVVDEQWRTFQASYFVQHPTFEASVKGGNDQLDRESIVAELKIALADPGRPRGIQHASSLGNLIASWEQYSAARGQLVIDQRKASQDKKKQLDKAFSDWLAQWAIDHPELEPFARSVIRPLAEARGLPRGLEF